VKPQEIFNVKFICLCSMTHVTHDMYTGVRKIRCLLIKEIIVLKELENILFIIQICKMRIKLIKIIKK